MKCLDLFDHKFDFYFNGKTTKKTNFGGVITILVVAINLCIFAFFASDMFLKKNPNVNMIFETHLNENEAYVPKLGFNFYHENRTVISDWKKIFSIEMSDGENKYYGNTTACQRDFFTNFQLNTTLYEKMFNKHFLEDANCLDEKGKANLKKNNLLNIVKCNNQTYANSIPQCYPDAIINKNLTSNENKFYFGFFYEDQSPNFDNPTDKLNLYKFYYIKLDANLRKDIILMTSILNVFIDNGLFVTSRIKEAELNYVVDSFIDYNFKVNDSNKEKFFESPFFTLKIISALTKKNMYFDYNKIQNALAKLSYITIITVSLGSYLTSKITSVIYQDDLINEIYNIKPDDWHRGFFGLDEELKSRKNRKIYLEDMDKNDKFKLVPNNIEVDSVFEKSGRSMNESKDMDEAPESKILKPSEKHRLKEYLKLKKIKNKEERKSNFSNCDIITIKFCSCCKSNGLLDHKYKMHEKVKELSIKYIDVKYIAKRTLDFSLFKYILLGENQLKLYNLILDGDNPIYNNFELFYQDFCRPNETLFTVARDQDIINENIKDDKIIEILFEMKENKKKTKSEERIIKLYECLS